MPNDAAVAAPSAAASESTLSVPTDSQAYAEWRQTGKLPTKQEATAASDEPTNKDDAASSSKSSDAKPKGEAKASPDPESGSQELHRKGKLSAKERADQLEAENNAEEDRLRQQLKRRADLRRQASGEEPADEKNTAESSTAKADVKKDAPKGLEPPVKPKWDDFKDKDNGYEEYEAAKDDYTDKMSDYKVAKALADERARQKYEKEVGDFFAKVGEAKGRYPDFDDKKLDEAAGQIYEDQAISPIVKQMFGESDCMIDVLYVMAKDAGRFDNFLQLARTSPTKAAREFAVTESLVKQELGKSKVEKKEAPPRDESGKFQKTTDADDDESPESKAPEKKTTAAPPPADEVGSRGSVPPDQVASAAKRNDFKAFRDAANRRDQASRRG